MRRRELLWILGGSVVAGTIGCHDNEAPPRPEDGVDAPGGSDDAVPVDANGGVDACAQVYVKMHDTYAQALYLDGTLGPLTGVIAVDYVVAGTTITLDFWHGHGGVQHRYTLEPEHFAKLKAGERVELGTTTVDSHEHTLFIDPRDEDYRVPGAPDVDVATGCA